MLKNKEYKVLNVAHVGSTDSVGILEHAGTGKACCDEHLAPNEGFWVVGSGENVNYGSDMEAAFEDYLRRLVGNVTTVPTELEGFFLPEQSNRIIAKVLFEKFLEHELDA